MSSSSPQKFQTPPPTNKALQRMRYQREQGLVGRGTPRRLFSQSCDGSSSTVKPPKTVYLIRHGESLGQRAGRRDRKNDPDLTDCGLSPQGKWQAQEMLPELLGEEVYKSIDLVVSSPLTRALETAVAAFPDKPILIHYQLREIGNMIPENIPRRTANVLADLKKDGYSVANIDSTTLQPDQWPRRHDTPPKVVRRDRIRQAFAWLMMMSSTPEEDLDNNNNDDSSVGTIAVVCHYHVIRAALDDFSGGAPSSTATQQLKPKNATPIKCHLCEDGRLIMAESNNYNDKGDA